MDTKERSGARSVIKLWQCEQHGAATNMLRGLMDQVEVVNERKHKVYCFKYSIRWRLNVAGFDERLCPTHEWLFSMDGNR